MTAHFEHKMPYGAEILAGGRVRFRLWAPGCRAVTVVIEAGAGEHACPMRARDHGWFEYITGAAGAGSRYRYQLEDGFRVPDPASRFQPDDVHAASTVIDPNEYRWQHPKWRGRPWSEVVLYEAHVGAFTPEGDYRGVIDKLDHLVDVGVTALELMPLADFEGRRNWGYDGVLPFAPDASYGTPTELKQLIDAAHERGLMIFLDVVYNHFGPSGNYLMRYAPEFFTERYQTPWGDAIDFTQPPVREFFIHNALYWLEEYRFDGLRLDAVDQIHDPSAEHFLIALANAVHTRLGRDRHVHLVLENDDNAVRYLERKSDGEPRLYTAQWDDDFHHAAHVLLTGEDSGYYADYAAEPIAAFGRALAEGFVYQGEASHFRHGRHRGEPSRHLPPAAFVSFLQNHDQVGNRAFGKRMDALADIGAHAALTAVWLLAPQTPLLFMGQEWGEMRPFYFFCDYHDELARTVREGRRREFARFSQFADPESRERIPDPDAADTFSASVLDWAATRSKTASERLTLVHDLLAIRRRAIVPHLPVLSSRSRYAVARESVLRVEWQLHQNTWLRLVVNLTPADVDRLNWPLQGELLYAHPEFLTGHRVTGLPPWAVVWTLASEAAG